MVQTFGAAEDFELPRLAERRKYGELMRTSLLRQGFCEFKVEAAARPGRSGVTAAPGADRVSRLDCVGQSNDAAGSAYINNTRAEAVGVFGASKQPSKQSPISSGLGGGGLLKAQCGVSPPQVH